MGRLGEALPLVTGDETPTDDRDAWEWLRNPLPPASEDVLFATLRLQLRLPDRSSSPTKASARWDSSNSRRSGRR